MSQLTFEQMNVGSPESPQVSDAAPPAPESWYKGKTLSHSSITTYKQCPQRWKFRYVDKIPEKPRSYFSFGKSVHTGLEFLFSKLKEGIPTLEELLNHYRVSWIVDGYDSKTQEKWFFQEGERILKGFYAKHKDEHARVLEVEFRFTIDIEGVPVIGFIDRVDETPSGALALIDYKTGKTIDPNRPRKDPQLTLYQMACRTKFNRPVETLTLYHLNSLSPLTVPAHSAEMEVSLCQTVREVAKDITDSKFDPKTDPNGYCRWCDYLQICPAFSRGGRANNSSEKIGSDMAETVDRYGKLEERIQSLKKEKEELGKTLTEYLKNTKGNRAEGRHYSVSLDEAKSDSPPSINLTPNSNTQTNEITD